MCIEANIEYIAGLVKHRRCRVVQAAVADRDHAVMKFRMRGVIGGLIGSRDQPQPQPEPQPGTETETQSPRREGQGQTKGQRQTQGQGLGNEGDGLDNKESSLPPSSSSLRGGEMTVHTVTLTHILDHLQSPRQMDLLLVDIEGGLTCLLRCTYRYQQHFDSSSTICIILTDTLSCPLIFIFLVVTVVVLSCLS